MTRKTYPFLVASFHPLSIHVLAGRGWGDFSCKHLSRNGITITLLLSRTGLEYSSTDCLQSKSLWKKDLAVQRAIMKPLFVEEHLHIAIQISQKQPLFLTSLDTEILRMVGSDIST